ncbi:MAG: HAD family hydrolase [Moraxella sp.]|jgi:phosphoglycolate phosphatase
MMKTFKDKSLIIFDWDGTLMDSVGLIVAAMRHAAEQNGLTVSDEATKSIIGIALVDAFPLLFPHDSDKHGAILASYSDYYIKHCDNDKLFDGIKELIKCLHTQGKILAVATGKKRQGLARVLPNSGIEPFFTISCCADETAGKPNPLMLQTILAETGKAVEEAVFIGDSIHDIRMANNIHMDSIAVSYGCESAEVLRMEHPNALVSSVTALTKLLLSAT